LAGGLELGRQVEARACPAPRRIVLPIGSAATTAGISAGLALAKKLGIWRAELPTLEVVRIAPWPLSRRARVLRLAEKALATLAELTGDAGLVPSRGELPELELVTSQLGPGYPHPTPEALQAQRWFAEAGYPILDGTYSGKAAAHLFAPGTLQHGPVLFWATKSSAPLP
jgi:D-cysteine desulfhydrase